MDNSSIFSAYYHSFNILKNQTKPLVKLAKAAERFGKGDYVNDFRASGAQEIRKAAFEFDRMAKELIAILIKEQKCFRELVMT